MKEISYGVHFQNLRVFKANGHWEYHGAVHESLRLKENLGYEPRYGAFPGDDLYTIHDYTSKRAVEEDVRLMETELEKDPDSMKWHFHLAKAYADLPDGAAKTIYHYGKRINLSENVTADEQNYISYLYAAEKLLSLYVADKITDEVRDAATEVGLVAGPKIDTDDLIAILKRARDYLEYRYEAWCQLATLYWHQLHDAEMCFQYSSLGLKVGNMGSVRQMTLLASDTPMYCLHVRRCVCGFHIQRYGESLESCAKIDGELPRGGMASTWEMEYKNTVQEYLQQLRANGVQL